MTRINTLPVKLLLDQHLMAEYRELPMVMASLYRSLVAVDGRAKNLRIPNNYTLGAGHVSFFYNKEKYLFTRWKQLIKELKHRGFQVDPSAREVDWSVFDTVKQVQWEPTASDRIINFERIVQRFSMKPNWYKYRGKSISVGVYVKVVMKGLT